jgi:glycine dehydrogenase subunit 1
MDFISNQEKQIKEMQSFLSIDSIKELWKSVPQQILQPRPSVDDGLSELEVQKFFDEIANKNKGLEYESYLGGGLNEHFVTALQSFILSKSEFLTSYTQYQPEVSQGMLQAIFEYQSCMAAITGLEVSNASLYDEASASAEAVCMALRINPDKKRVHISPNISNTLRGVIDQYLFGQEVIVCEDFNFKEDSSLAFIQSPNFLGQFEEVLEIFKEAKKMGCITILASNPLAMTLFKNPKELLADIAVGSLQHLGLPLAFGGPHAGFIVTKKEFMRQLPGRIVGMSKDNQDREGFLLSLQTREQHIRREKATSNICSNQALMAIGALVSVLYWGKEGLKKLALTNYQRAHYLHDHLSKLNTVQSVSSKPFFNEFIVTFKKPVDIVLNKFQEEKIIAGLKLEYQSLLVAVTETKDKKSLDKYVKVANDI